jgi:hypothetical protein
MTIRDEITCLTSGCYIHKKWKAAWCRELEEQRLTIILFFPEYAGELCIIVLRRNKVSRNHTTHPRLHSHVTSAPITN